MAKDYAQLRAAVLRDLDGLRYEVDPETKIGRLILDRPPLTSSPIAVASRSTRSWRRSARTTTCGWS